ncbi:mechanosensitive ion channel family protein [Tellurirhabdus rosea]|uniref:mechanosensitive ion channel family protein n=1 Tax=Tellurirhabdus rosea TaxID=2674997 RepID=UPI00225B541F|nr:mechanosensitive ion channel family protein [Tellurirhabdus rosea]
MLNIQELLGLIYKRLHAWAEIIFRNIPNFIVAVLLIVLFTLLARLAARILTRGLGTVSDNPALVTLTGTVAKLVITAVGLFFALGVLGLDKTVTSLLAGAGILALAIGFAFQDLTTNFVSGAMIALARPIQVGDVVETNGFTGRVVSIKLRSIVLDNFQGQFIELPSKDVFQKSVINYSRTGWRRLEVVCGVSYADDLEKAQQTATQAIQALPFVRADRPVEVFFKTFTLDMVQFTVGFWIDQPGTNPAHATSEVIKTLKKAFDEQDLLIPFVPHTFDLKKRVREERND